MTSESYIEDKNFCMFILSYNRADNVKTYNYLRRCGYTGDIRIIVEDKDPQLQKYLDNFGEEVVTFSKEEAAKYTDPCDNLDSLKGVVYARNASFHIAEELGYKYFMQLDDDYRFFYYKFNVHRDYGDFKIKNLDLVINKMITYLKNTPFYTIAMAQQGDFIGGKDNSVIRKEIPTKRKAMNSFLCDVDRRFYFKGRSNEDVNTYTYLQQKGIPFLTLLGISLEQIDTQASSGGMTELYMDQGTYVKSFYTVMTSPSCAKVSILNSTHARIHHQISWKNAAPYILPEKYKK